MYKPLSLVLVSLLFLAATCKRTVSDQDQYIYRERMVSFVSSISDYAKDRDNDFIVIPQNGIQLLAEPDDSTPVLEPNERFLNAIDGIGRESVFYGYNADNEATPAEARTYINQYLQMAKKHEKRVLVTDYAHDHRKMDKSYAINDSLGYISFAANRRALDVIPPYPTQPHTMNDRNIDELRQAENFLYLINTQQYQEKSTFIEDLASTNYDLLILDLFFLASESLTTGDIEQLQFKANGSRRLVIAYMSIGEAEDYRYYWKRLWERYPPHWLGEENPNWEGNYLVQYWEPDWQEIIYGNEEAYLDRILSTGFDGVYLDLVDAYHNFEQKAISAN